MQATEAAKRGRIKFNAEHLPILHRFTGQQDIRWYLNGIQFEPAPQGGVFAVATNGHMLCAVHDPVGECEEPRTIKISRDALRFCRPNIKRLIAPHLVVDGGRATILARPGGDEELFVQPNDCRINYGGVPGEFDSSKRFPEWQRIMPNPDDLKPGTPNWFAAAYIREAAAAAPKADHSFGASMRFWSVGDESGCAVVTFADQHNIAIVVMPRREHCDDAITKNQIISTAKGGKA